MLVDSLCNFPLPFLYFPTSLCSWQFPPAPGWSANCWAAPHRPTSPVLAQLQDWRAQSQQQRHLWFNGQGSLHVWSKVLEWHSTVCGAQWARLGGSLRSCGGKVFQEGGPLPGPESGLLSNAWKWIVQGDTRADKARDFIGEGCSEGEQQGKGTQENCHVAHSLRFYGNGVSFQVVSEQSFWLRVLPGGAPIVQPRWIPVRRILGGR